MSISGCAFDGFSLISFQTTAPHTLRFQLHPILVRKSVLRSNVLIAVTLQLPRGIPKHNGRMRGKFSIRANYIFDILTSRSGVKTGKIPIFVTTQTVIEIRTFYPNRPSSGTVLEIQLQAELAEPFLCQCVFVSPACRKGNLGDSFQNSTNRFGRLYAA
jgi:hypothetical protein